MVKKIIIHAISYQKFSTINGSVKSTQLHFSLCKMIIFKDPIWSIPRVSMGRTLLIFETIGNDHVPLKSSNWLIYLSYNYLTGELLGVEERDTHKVWDKAAWKFSERIFSGGGDGEKGRGLSQKMLIHPNLKHSAGTWQKKFFGKSGRLASPSGIQPGSPGVWNDVGLQKQWNVCVTCSWNTYTKMYTTVVYTRSLKVHRLQET